MFFHVVDMLNTRFAVGVALNTKTGHQLNAFRSDLLNGWVPLAKTPRNDTDRTKRKHGHACMNPPWWHRADKV